MDSMQPQGQKRRPMADINVVPYIDVMLVLLIIFMVTAPMLVQSVPVDLPDVDATATDIKPDDSMLTVSVTADGLYYVEREEEEPQAMSLEEVVDYAGKMKSAVPETQVMIRGDQNVPYGSVVALMGGLQGVGVTNLGLITEAPTPQVR
ncbi:protein TolR [Parathalassolituus penaei]|nr:protein TolR [Parathalassolituus penaei]